MWLYQAAEKNHVGLSGLSGLVWSIWFIWSIWFVLFIWLIWFIWLVSLNPKIRQTKFRQFNIQHLSFNIPNAASRLTPHAQHPATHPVADNATSDQTQPNHPAPPDVGPAQDRGRRRGLAM